jgi:hypothetical protein
MPPHAKRQPVPDVEPPTSPTFAFEQVLNTEEAAAAVTNPPKDTSENGARGDSAGLPNRRSLAVSRLGPKTSGSILPYAQSATRAVNTKGRFSLFTRTRYQYGSLELKERKKGKEVWEFRYYETDARGQRQRRAAIVGTQEDYPTESAARKSPAVQAMLLRLNAEQPTATAGAAEFGAVIARYEQEEMPERYSTKAAYQSYINNQIRPRWAQAPLNAIKPMAVEDWLRGLDLAPKTKSHVRSLMHTIFRCAERCELTDKNPIKLVRVKVGTKRLKMPRVLTPEQFESLLLQIREPYRTMVLVAGCLGLRVSEIVALQWRDFDFPGLTLLVQRSIVMEAAHIILADPERYSGLPQEWARRILQSGEPKDAEAGPLFRRVA